MDMRASRKSFRRRLLAPVVLALSLGLLGAPSPVHAKELINQAFGGIAIQGYDPVAYFTDGQAVKGSDEFAYEWLGATWHFANAEHRDLFAADPVKYAPQYGGYCASALTEGAISSASPQAWRIVDGKLYLYGTQGGQLEWANNPPEHIVKADAQWQLLKADMTE